MNRPMAILLSAGLMAVAVSPATAQSIAGVEFPDGERSFADRVVDYSAPADQPTEPHRHPAGSIGVPDFDRDDFDTYVSLGQGGSLTLRFSDNSLTGSGDTEPDLWIFEIGQVVEDTFVEISSNGRDWAFVGEVRGATSGIDIDAFMRGDHLPGRSSKTSAGAGKAAADAAENAEAAARDRSAGNRS